MLYAFLAWLIPFLLLLALLGCMLRAFQAVRVTFHTVSRSPEKQRSQTRLQVSGSTFTAITTASAHGNLRSDRPRNISSTSMFRSAAVSHKASQETGQVFAKWQPLASATPPGTEPLKGPMASDTTNGNRHLIPGSGNAQKFQPLKAIGTTGQSEKPKEQVSGFKRTASGLAKALGGQNAFEESNTFQMSSKDKAVVTGKKISPAKGVMPGVFFDENDFDSDIDLDIEDPAMKGTISYPQLPSVSRSVSDPSRRSPPFNASTPAKKIGSLFKSGSPKKVKLAQTPGSSMPLQWSSSPVEQQQMRRQAVPLKDRTNEALRNERRNSADEAKVVDGARHPAKRRALPWQKEEEKNISATPVSGKSQNSLLWNTTASALKERQKQLRDKGKEAKARDDADTNSTGVKQRTSKSGVSRVFLSDEQQHVLDLVINQKKSVFYTGSAGTGKSVLLREIIAGLRKKYLREPDRVAVTASTGLAACNIGGVTLHSFAGIGLGKEPPEELIKKIRRNQKAKHRWMRTKVLIVDEVSMVDGDLFDKLEQVARVIRNNGRPFGGIQLVITGDFFQLPPVPDYGRISRFAFDANTWNTSIEFTIGLHKVFRQKDPAFAGMLNEMREGKLSHRSIEAFNSLSRDLDMQDGIGVTELFPTRSEVDRANNFKMQHLTGYEEVFFARDGGSIQDKAQRDKLLQNCMAAEEVRLKVGAQVMLIKNIDDTLVNGSLGYVRDFVSEEMYASHYNRDDEDEVPNGDFDISTTIEKKLKPKFNSTIGSSQVYPLIRFTLADGTHRELLCHRETWKIELPNGEVQASRSQVPLILAWALSIHKAQGQTLERVKVDLGRVFEKGQAYVALSRATTIQGLQVLRFDPKKVLAHERVRHFYAGLSKAEHVAKKKKAKTTAVKGGKSISAIVSGGGGDGDGDGDGDGYGDELDDVDTYD